MFFDFTEDPQGWTYVTFPELFSQPNSSHTAGSPGTLNITATSNASNFGLWQSPGIDVDSFNIDSPRGASFPQVYAATWRVRSTATSALTLPQFRLRSIAQNSQQADLIAVESLGDASYSPTTGNPKDFVLHFTTAAGSPVYNFAFDLVGLDTRDDPGGTVQLDSLLVEVVPASTFSSPRLERSFSFTSSTENWFTGNASPILEVPTFSYDSAGGRLAMQVMPTDDFVFGYWGSPESGSTVVVPESGRTYYGVFTVGTDQTTADLVPTFRCRINEHNFRVAQLTAVASTGPAQNVPTLNNPRQYVVFFPPNTGTDSFLQFSIDLLSAPSIEGTAPEGRIYLENLDVYSVPVGGGS